LLRETLDYAVILMNGTKDLNYFIFTILLYSNLIKNNYYSKFGIIKNYLKCSFCSHGRTVYRQSIPKNYKREIMADF